jgi:hypothetical protein
VADSRVPPCRTPDNQFPGGHRGRVTPVPIPNTEVKPATADGTARAGGWESRSLPGLFFASRPAVSNRSGLLFVRRACSTAWRCKSSPNLMEVKGSEPQGRHREVASGGSGEQTHEPRDTNRIRGVSAGRASKRSRSPSPSRARSVNPAVACGQRSNLSREVCAVSAYRTERVARRADRGAEVSRGRSRRGCRSTRVRHSPERGETVRARRTGNARTKARTVKSG